MILLQSGSIFDIANVNEHSEKWSVKNLRRQKLTLQTLAFRWKWTVFALKIGHLAEIEWLKG